MLHKEKRIDGIEEKQKNDFEHLQRIDAKVEHLEIQVSDTQTQIQEVNEGVRRIGKSQISLLRHFVTGNGQKEMTDEADDLTEDTEEEAEDEAEDEEEEAPVPEPEKKKKRGFFSRLFGGKDND